ncbi:MAG: hypothetical protein JXR94_24280 [Candidatus Hydrogenedentes bacterium]|nr:hypothetical protein [Candidatus Hydrogenedentota bacterium]
MRRGLIAACALLFLAAAYSLPAAAGDSFEARLRQGNDALRAGDAEGALRIYRDLQIEEPESDELHYATGCAYYESAMARRDVAPSAANDLLEEAAKSFRRAWTSRNAWIGVNAEYNLANVLAQQAKLAAAGGDEEALEGFAEEAIQRYEGLLDRHPDHEKARQNLKYMRYWLKKMLQDPPPPQQKQQQNSGQEQGKDGQQQEQSEGRDGQQQEKSEGEDRQQQDQQEEQQQQQEQQQQPSPGKQAPPEDGMPEELMPDEASPEEQQADAEPQDKQNIEAILESLEDLDQLEQQDRRKGPMDSRVRREWW